MSEYTKYPSTLHLPWSRGVQRDDKIVNHIPYKDGDIIVVTEKMDGENTTMYPNHIHARSIDGNHHESQDWVKTFWSSFRYIIPTNIRICGENMYAKHSIFYDDLPSYFLGFSVWENDVCLSWVDTLEWFELLGIRSVPVLYIGPYSREALDQVELKLDIQHQEGYVVRPANEFSASEFENSITKWVRAEHVQTDDHWKHQQIIPNILRKRDDS